MHRLTGGTGYETLDTRAMKRAFNDGITPIQFLARSTHPRAQMAQAILQGYPVELPPPYPPALSNAKTFALISVTVFLVFLAIGYATGR